MHLLARVLVAVVGLALVTCNPTNCPSATTAEEAKKAETALFDFAVNFYKNVSAKNQDKNVVLSPVSVALALSMLESGAGGTTQDKIKAHLVGAGSNVDVLTAYRALQKQLSISDDSTKLAVANGIFPSKELTLKPDFEAVIRNCFESQIEKVDYAGQLEQARQKINKFVSDKTSAKIPELFKPDILTPDVVLVLANAIYFKGAWAASFSGGNTKEGAFYRFGREQDRQTVKFMSQVGSFGYAADDKVEVAELSYKGDQLDFYVILPKTKDGLSQFEQSLTGEKLNSLISQVRPTQVKLILPKFTVRSPVDLKTILSGMDLENIFSNGANFGRISALPLKVSKAVHEAYINVNENGTEAAAATGFAMTPKSARPTQQTFTADHPFLYAIRHKPTGAIIFLGKVNFVEEKEN